MTHKTAFCIALITFIVTRDGLVGLVESRLLHLALYTMFLSYFIIQSPTIKESQVSTLNK